MPGGGSRGVRGKAPDWLKKQRQQQQMRDVQDKSAREIDYFWDMQDSNKRYDSDRGGAPRKGWKTIQADEEELFEQKAGMAAGIDFDHYDEISVEINGKGVENIKICDTYEDVAWEFKLPEWLNDNIWRCHYTKPTPVQKYAIPTGLSKFDMMVCAQVCQYCFFHLSVRRIKYGF